MDSNTIIGMAIVVSIFSGFIALMYWVIKDNQGGYAKSNSL